MGRRRCVRGPVSVILRSLTLISDGNPVRYRGWYGGGEKVV
jgi:hypothetical protein